MKLCCHFRSVLVLSYKKNLVLNAVLGAAPKITQNLREKGCAASCPLRVYSLQCRGRGVLVFPSTLLVHGSVAENLEMETVEGSVQ